MEKEKPKFNALTPEVLEEGNKSIYNEALDFAFSNKNIKNIAITGIYGAGKSTVWNTYVKETKKENIITVSLGKYEDNIDEIDKKLEDKESSSEINIKKKEDKEVSEHFLDNENRVERQIINQILSQIKTKDIPLSKYGFKSNKSICKIGSEIIAFLSLISSILLWIIRKDFISYTRVNPIYLIILCTILFFYIFNIFFL